MRRTEFVRGLVVTVLLLAITRAGAQTLRFDTYREPQAPENANLRIGSFYSDWVFDQAIGYRYIRSSGDGATYLHDQRFGRVRKDGSDFPMVSRLGFRNYLLVSKYMDVDCSFDLRYSYFPMGTEDNEFTLEFADPGLSARMGSFTFGATEDGWLGTYSDRGNRAYTGSEGYGFMANLSSDFQLTPVVRGRVYDNPSYRVDYVDDRGYTDFLSGRKYPVFQNVVGVDLDWLMAKDKNLSYSANRTDTLPQDDYFKDQKSVVYRQSLIYQQQLNPVAAGGVRADYWWRDYYGRRGNQFQQDYAGFLTAALSEDTTFSGTLGYSTANLRDAGAYENEGSSDAYVGSALLSSRLSQSLVHRLGLSRQQRAGFQGGLEIVNAFTYALTWHQDLWSAGFQSNYEAVDPRLSRSAGYRDWVNQVSVSRLLSPDLTATLATAYLQRQNDDVKSGDAGEGVLMLTNDYNTWVTNLGLNYVLSQYWTAYAYAEHLVRYSNNPGLEFSRDIVGVTLVYRYDF